VASCIGFGIGCSSAPDTHMGPQNRMSGILPRNVYL
jgi:hypothetical protein